MAGQNPAIPLQLDAKNVQGRFSFLAARIPWLVASCSHM
jgi:hypothetical protein